MAFIQSKPVRRRTLDPLQGNGVLATAIVCFSLGLASVSAGCSSPSDEDPTPTQTPASTPTDSPTTPTPTHATPTSEPMTPTPVNSTPTLPPEETPFPQVSYDLTAPVEIVLDEVGMPHIYADTTADALWGQGYMVMRDRMFQMDVNRRIAGGRSAELLGEYYYQVDLLYRSLNFRDLCNMIYQDIRNTNPKLAELLEAYAAGANAYLADAIAGKNGASLSPQVLAVGYVPEP